MNPVMHYDACTARPRNSMLHLGMRARRTKSGRGVSIEWYEWCSGCSSEQTWTRQTIPRELTLVTLFDDLRPMVETWRGRTGGWAEQPLDRTERTY